jgi:hypothetical protein
MSSLTVSHIKTGIMKKDTALAQTKIDDVTSIKAYNMLFIRSIKLINISVKKICNVTSVNDSKGSSVMLVCIKYSTIK